MRDRAALPEGTVTFLFSDIEGSTKLLAELGAERYATLLEQHRAVMREAFRANDGVEIGTEGDSFFVAFPTAPGALRAAAAAQEGLITLPVRVRMGIHTGTAQVAEGDYVGMDVHRAARIAAAGHGGQVLISAATVALSGTGGLRDLGDHRLKDLAAPERIWQLGTEAFAPLRSLHQTNLPVAATPFIGRAGELRDIGALLADEAVRVVTLTGPGGTGKTRLAMQVAAEAAGRYPNGIWWVELDALRSAELVLPTAAAAIGAKGELAEHIGDRRMLVALDNFEQVIEASRDVAALLARCPHLELVVTSREPLRIRAEREFPVPPLAPNEGVALFVERARDLGRDVATDADVAEICRRLDDLPLAIELAAARVTVLSPAQIALRLGQRLPLLASRARDLPERQRTLRGAIEWSHELLTAEEQRLFARLSVFHGGWSLEAAEAIADADLDVLHSLADKSLIRRYAERFGMLETIREYAVERLTAAADGDALRGLHAEHFLALAREAGPFLRRDSPEWADRLERDHDNLRAALDELQASGRSEAVLEMVGALSRFWYLRSHYQEGQRRLEAALATDERPSAARAAALMGASVMALNIRDLELARARADQALQLNRSLGDAWGVAYSTMMLGNAIAEREGGAQAARPVLEESVRLFHDLGDELYALIASLNVGWIIEELGDVQAAKALHENVLRRARALGDERIAVSVLGQLAMYARDEGKLAESAAMLREAVRVEHLTGDVGSLAIELGRLASVLVRDAEPRAAARLLGSSAALLEQLGVRQSWWAERRNEETRSMLLAALGGGEFAALEERGRALTVDQAVALALDEASVRTRSGSPR